MPSCSTVATADTGYDLKTFHLSSILYRCYSGHFHETSSKLYCELFDSHVPDSMFYCDDSCLVFLSTSNSGKSIQSYEDSFVKFRKVNRSSEGALSFT